MEPLTQTERIIPVLSYILNQMVSKNDKLPFPTDKVTIFHAGNPPSISIQSYLERIMKYAPCSHECFILGLVYIDRIIQQNQSFLITSLNIHRLLITGVMLAAKFFDDCYFNNAYYAKVGGVPCFEMNILELEFLFLIKFSLNVSSDLFDSYRYELMKHSLRINGALMLKGAGAVDFEEYKIKAILNQYLHEETSRAIPATSALQIQHACEQLVGDEVRKKSLSPSVIKRASELLVVEAKQLPMSPGVVKSVCELLVQENKRLSPSLVRRASELRDTLRGPKAVVCGAH